MLQLNPGSLARLDYQLLRPLLTKILAPEYLVKFYSFARDPFIKKLQNSKFKVDYSAITKEFTCFKNNLKFRNDLGNAAGFDKDGSLLEFNYQIGAGFALVGTVLNKPHTGNWFPCFGKKCNPWMPLHFSHSALNSLGLPSKGVHRLKEQILKFKDLHQPTNFPIGVSLMGHPLAEGSAKIAGVIECMEVLGDCVDFFEINESCPNTSHDSGMNALQDRVTQIMKKRSEISEYKPILFKLADFGMLSNTLDFYANHEVDALSFTNTLKNYPDFIAKIDRRDLKHFSYYIENHQGGLSGQAIRDYTFKQVREASKYIEAQGLSVKLLQVGGLATNLDLRNSRELKPVVLRQWYTGLLQTLANNDFSQVYSGVL